MILKVINRQARIVGGQLLTSGSVGMPLEFEFSEAWEDLNKIVCFKGSGVEKDIALSGSTCYIPWECMTQEGPLYVGVYGYRLVEDEKEIVIPTVWATIGNVVAGTDPHGDETVPITPDIAEQVISIAESVRSDADSGKFNGKDGYTPIKGKDYFDGVDGRTPVKGVDYFDGKDGEDGKDYILTESDKHEIADMINAPVTDVTINGSSIVDGGVAAVPNVAKGIYGLVKISSNVRGLTFDTDDSLIIHAATEADIDARNVASGASRTKPITPINFDYAVKAAMTDGKGAAWTDEEKAAARARMGLGDFELIADATITEETSVFLLDGIHLSRAKIILQAPSGGASLRGGVMISGRHILGGVSNFTAGNGTRILDVSAEHGMLTTLTAFFSTPNIDGYTGTPQTGNAGLALAMGYINSIRFDISEGYFTIGTKIKIYGVRA